MNKLTNWLIKPFLDENVDLPINIGDTVKMGKFKNKKVVVKKIDWNEKGDLLINGKVATKWRMFKKKPNIPNSPFEEDVNVVKKKGKDAGDYRTYTSPEDSDIEEPYKPKKTLKKESAYLTVRNKINDDLNNKGKSVPFLLEDEKQYNLFLNQNSKLGTIIKKELGFTDFELFAYLRKAKDSF